MCVWVCLRVQAYECVCVCVPARPPACPCTRLQIQTSSVRCLSDLSSNRQLSRLLSPHLRLLLASPAPRLSLSDARRQCIHHPGTSPLSPVLSFKSFCDPSLLSIRPSICMCSPPGVQFPESHPSGKISDLIHPLLVSFAEVSEGRECRGRDREDSERQALQGEPFACGCRAASRDARTQM